jgi:predicted phage tail protein
MQLKKIKVYGTLRKILGKSYFEAAVKSPRDAIKFLVCNFPFVEKHLNEQMYKIKMNGVQIWQEDLALSGQGDIQLIPIATGSGFLPALFITGAKAAAAVGGAIVTGTAAAAAAAASAAVAGATAVVSAIASGAGAVYAAAVALSEAGFIGNLATNLLVNTAIDGVVSLLTPDQSLDISEVSIAGGAGGAGGDPENPNSFPSLGFNQIQNVAVSGGAVPIIYGEVFTGSIVISASTDVQQIKGEAE